MGGSFVPGRREAWLSAGAIFALALVVRAVVAASLSFPVPEDTAYYAGVARNLVEGHGLVTDALWSYQTQPLVVPRAAFEVWLPLPSLLAAVPIAVAGAANWFRAAQVVSVVVSSLVAALAWRLGADVATEMKLPPGRARTLGVGTGLVACFLGPLVVYGALPDSTALFAALSLAACLLMTRIAARPAGARDRRLLALGLLIGFAGLTRSEALWLGVAWLLVAWFWTPAPGGGGSATGSAAGSVIGSAAGSATGSAAGSAGTRLSRLDRARLIAVPAAVAILVFVPWAVRDWLVFGSPLPGQTIANALSIKATDIFAYQDQPTLARYLAQGPVALAAMRVTGIVHNLVMVLIVQAFPIGLAGVLALPWCARLRALRPLLLVAAMTFLVTSLVFPVSTTWGTFLHAAGAIYVLLAVSCLVALDAVIAWVGRIRHWWRPVAWLGPALATAVAIPLMFVSVASLDRQAGDTRARFDALPAAMERAGISLSDNAPIITNSPIWLAETSGVTAVALPEEPPQTVLALARHFGSKLLVTVGVDETREWPGVLDGPDPAAGCFKEVRLTDNSGIAPNESSPLAEIRVFLIVCP